MLLNGPFLLVCLGLHYELFLAKYPILHTCSQASEPFLNLVQAPQGVLSFSETPTLLAFSFSLLISPSSSRIHSYPVPISELIFIIILVLRSATPRPLHLGQCLLRSQACKQQPWTCFTCYLLYLSSCALGEESHIIRPGVFNLNSLPGMKEAFNIAQHIVFFRQARAHLPPPTKASSLGNFLIPLSILFPKNLT